MQLNAAQQQVVQEPVKQIHCPIEWHTFSNLGEQRERKYYASPLPIRLVVR